MTKNNNFDKKQAIESLLKLQFSKIYNISLVILARAIARARPHTRPKGFARAILSVQLTCEICYYTCKCAKYRTPSNFFIDKTVIYIYTMFL